MAATFLDVVRQHQAIRLELEKSLTHLVDDMKAVASAVADGAEIEGRIKTISSSWLKARLKTQDLEELDDLIGLRVLVNRRDDCYRVMALASERWTAATPVQDRIAHPKKNGYQSLQAIFQTTSGGLFELQVRTREMQRVCESGTASHRRYKARQLASGGGEPAPAAPAWLDGRRELEPELEMSRRNWELMPTLLGVFATVALVGALDFWSGWAVGFAIFYLIPVALATWRAGGRTGLLAAALCTAVWWWVDGVTSPLDIHPIITVWNAIMRFGIFALLSVTFHELRVALRKNEDLARCDQLTGLPNARAFFERAEAFLAASRTTGRELTLAFVDLDDFKGINSRLGHMGADRLLQDWGAELQAAVRTIDTVARLGGDEFAILMPNTDGDDARAVVERLHQRLAARASELQPPVRFSMGAVTFQSPPGSVDELLQEADLLMYEAKADKDLDLRHDVRDRNRPGST